MRQAFVWFAAVLAVGCKPNIPRDLRTMEPGDLVITEVMMNPGAVADHVGEWIEIYAPGPYDVDINGVVIRNERGATGEIYGDGVDAIVPAESYALIARREEGAFASPELEPFAYWGQDPGFDDDSDLVELIAGKGTIDQTYTFGPIEAAEGVSWQLDPSSLDALKNDNPSSWCASTHELDSGDLGTPGAINDPC